MRTYLLLFPLPLLLLQPGPGRVAPPAVLRGGGRRRRAAHAAGADGRGRRERRLGRGRGALGRRVGRRGGAALRAAAAEGGVEGVERGAEVVVLDAAGRVRVLFL